MPRLNFSPAALVRALEITAVSITAFVEGMLDRTFFDKLLAVNTTVSGTKFTIRLAQEIDPALGNGKQAVLALFQLTKRRNKLSIQQGTAQKTALFFLDKDIDDIRRIQKRSPHVIYTEHYCLENYLYRHGDLTEALMGGAMLDRLSATRLAPNNVWVREAANSWAEWIAFCLTTYRARVPDFANYGTESLIHAGQNMPVNVGRLSSLLSAVATRGRMSQRQIQALYDKQLRRVHRSLGNDTFDRFFKGKWYLGFFVKDAERLASGRALPPHLPERLEAALVTTLDFSAAWTDELQRRVSSVVGRS